MRRVKRDGQRLNVEAADVSYRPFLASNKVKTVTRTLNLTRRGLRD